ncbi:hypothetical protein BC332_20700 [Capsicum chinense]|nr:hypothetical protein BC332_20700 [Capsicum chinense]
MGCVKLAFFILYTFLCQLVFSSALPHLCPEDQVHALLQFKQMFTINPNASDYCRRSRTLSWNKSTDCCSWNGVQCDEMTRQVIELDLYCSGLQGKFHTNSSLFKLSNLKRLDLSYNDFSGSLISPKFGELSNLMHLNLPRSSFTGNKLKGKVPTSLINCRYLKFLDLGHNELNDTFPSWLGGLPDLQILSLRSNKLHGPISDSRTDNLFAQIRVIDLSSNGFSENLPASLFENFQAMKIIGEKSGTREYIANDYSGNYANTLIVTTKGLDQELPRVLTTEIIINLSRNRFEGYLPRIIGDLVGLCTLKLSHNDLEGVIPTSLQHLSILESLDLSSNKIGGEIPQQLVSLTFLAVLNLSHNHLVGCIPRGKQFDTFENSSYQVNDGLRGLPLSKDCGGDDGVPQATTAVELDEEEEEGELISWQAVLMGFGCGLVIGLSIIYIMLSTQYPVWFSRMIVKFEHIIDTRMKRY